MLFSATKIAGYVLTSFSVIAIVLNSALLPLIALKSGKDIGSYKVLLFLYTLIALIYTSISFILVPVFEPSEKGWLFYATWQPIPRELGSYFICVFCACYIKLLLILTYSFVYRCLVMCKPFELRWFHETRRILTIIVIYLFVLSICAVPVFKFMRLNDQVAVNFRNSSVVEGYIELSNVSYIAMPMFNEGYPVAETMGIMAAWTCAMVSSTILSAFCSYKINSVLKDAAKVASMSNSTRRIQRRLFILLILQTLSPLCFTFIPGLMSYALAIAEIHAPIISQTSSALLPLAQAIDPILIFTVVSEYRRTGKLLILKYIFRRNINISAVRVSTSTNAA